MAFQRAQHVACVQIPHLSVWSDDADALCTLHGHSPKVNGVAVTLDGKRAVSASDDTLKVWDLETGRSPSFRA
jgi:WD40 repeat protein